MVCVILISCLTACSSNTPTVTAIAPLVPYQTLTPSETATLLPTLGGNFLPTATTTTYKVVEGDNLNSIASRFGVPLEALLTANPGLQATVLSVGTELIIPTGNITPAEPSPTPALLPVSQARCWPETDGGLWCFALVQNEYSETIENLSAGFTLLDTGGQTIGSQTAYALLDILPPGVAMPLAAHFPAPMPAKVSVRVQLLTGNRLLPGDARYLPVMLDDTLVSVDGSSGRSAQLSGRAILTGAGTANTLWVLATAFDAAGNVVGVRRWESASALTGGSPVPFEFPISSVGPPIERVEFLTEARP
jgi:LysM repeat protein